MNPFEFYTQLADSLPEIKQRPMFGNPTLSKNGKAIASFFQDCMVFKLMQDEVQQLLQTEAMMPFDPSGQGRIMKAWIQVPFALQDQWGDLLLRAAHIQTNTPQ